MTARAVSNIGSYCFFKPDGGIGPDSRQSSEISVAVSTSVESGTGQSVVYSARSICKTLRVRHYVLPCSLSLLSAQSPPLACSNSVLGLVWLDLIRMG